MAGAAARRTSQEADCCHSGIRSRCYRWVDPCQRLSARPAKMGEERDWPSSANQRLVLLCDGAQEGEVARQVFLAVRGHHASHHRNRHRDFGFAADLHRVVKPLILNEAAGFGTSLDHAKILPAPTITSATIKIAGLATTKCADDRWTKSSVTRTKHSARVC